MRQSPVTSGAGDVEPAAQPSPRAPIRPGSRRAQSATESRVIRMSNQFSNGGATQMSTDATLATSPNVKVQPRRAGVVNTGSRRLREQLFEGAGGIAYTPS